MIASVCRSISNGFDRRNYLIRTSAYPLVLFVQGGEDKRVGASPVGLLMIGGEFPNPNAKKMAP